MVKAGDADAIAAVLGTGVNVNEKDPESGRTALHIAAAGLDSRSIAALLAAPGVDTAALDGTGQNALHIVLSSPRRAELGDAAAKECLALLLDTGAAPVDPPTSRRQYTRAGESSTHRNPVEHWINMEKDLAAPPRPPQEPFIPALYVHCMFTYIISLVLCIAVWWGPTLHGRLGLPWYCVIWAASPAISERIASPI